MADANRICVVGFSMGADAALRLALHHGCVLAAVALFAGIRSIDRSIDRLRRVGLKHE